MNFLILYGLIVSTISATLFYILYKIILKFIKHNSNEIVKSDDDYMIWMFSNIAVSFIHSGLIGFWVLIA